MLREVLCGEPQINEAFVVGIEHGLAVIAALGDVVYHSRNDEATEASHHPLMFRDPARYFRKSVKE